MRKRSLRWGLVAAAVVGVATAVTAALVPWSANADSQKADGAWKTTYGSQKLGGRYSSMTVGDATHAWAFGNKNGDADDTDNQHTRIDRWDGEQWKPDTFPSTWTVTPEFADANSASNVWAVAETDVNHYTLLHYDGKKWSAKRINFHTVRDITAVGSNQLLLIGDQTLMRYDGTKLTEEPAPKYTNAGLTVRSADEMYAVGEHKSQPYVEKWNGETWASMKVPSVSLGKCSDAGFGAMYARSSKDIWATGSYLCMEENENEYLKPLLAHWNGKKWTMITDAKHRGGYGPVVDDGAGGIWAASNSDTGQYVHRAKDGTTTYYHAGVKGLDGLSPSIDNVPGTKSVIGIATMYDDSNEPKPYGVVSEYTP
ncbi:MAG TPA: hypothetical protein VE172_14500 [Stackebrandtia sp.]|uniref:hypothetical protein n=1 Tax=Stackebrandtia sp. TaxID=2023065 RepID=UPI002D51F8CB|nr:hypothetical protein [Stackebrandtia sp.]HZE40013.1 hypothetical protein [Stackebrandtia sp.]